MKSVKLLLLSAVFLFTAVLLFSQEQTIETSTTSDNSSEAVIQLPSITTFITKPKVEQRIVITQEQIEKENTSDFCQLLQNNGIQLLSYGTYGLQQTPSIRGFTDETVRVVIDGVCVNNPQYGTFDFSTLNLSSVEKIEIVKGGFTENITDEGAVGGVIYITSKKQKLGTGFYLSSAFKTFFNSSSPLDTVQQKAGTNLQLSDTLFFNANLAATFASNHYLFKAYGNTCSQNNASVQDLFSDLKLTKFLSNGKNISFTYKFYKGSKNTPGPIFSTNTGLQNDCTNFFIINYFAPELLKDFNLQSTLSYNNTDRNYTDKISKSAHYVNTITGTSLLDYSPKGPFSQKAGLNLSYTNLNSTDDGKHNQYTATLKSTTQFSITDHLLLTFPLSVKLQNTNFDFVPKAGLALNFNSTTCSLSLYKMVQFPNLDDLYWSSSGYSGNPNLKPEQGYGVELGINSKNTILPFTLSVYTNYYSRKIQWAADEDGNWSPQNISSAFYTGTDLSFSKAFFQDRLIITGTGEYIYTMLLNKNNPQTYKKQIMWVPDFVGSLKITLNLKKSSTTLNLNYVGNRYISNLNTNKMPPYLLLDLTSQYSLTPTLTFFFQGQNLTNTSYQSIKNYSMPGISLTAGVKLQKQ